MDKDTQIARANAARRILEDALWQEAFADISEQLRKAFNSDSMADADLVRLHLSNKMLIKLKAWFEARISQGNVVEFDLKKENRA